MLHLLFLLPALAVAFPGLEPRACGDNCARAVIASAYTTRHGSADCASYLLTTVTPATSTIIETSTLSFTPVETLSSTQISTTTTTVPSVVRITVPGYTTETVTSTETVYTNWPKSAFTLKKREQTSAPSVIPAYASPCFGAAKYTTACACLGVYPTTITVAAPLTTSTAYVSVSHTSTVTEIVTGEPQTVTITTSTTSLVLAFTTTVTALATATVPAFRLRVSGGQYANRNVIYGTEFFMTGLWLTTTSSSALWTLDTDTNTLIDTRTGYWLYVSSSSSPDVESPQVLSPADAASANMVKADCWVYASDSIMAVQCEKPDSPTVDEWTAAPRGSGDEILSLGTPNDAGSSPYSSALTLQLVGVNGAVY